MTDPDRSAADRGGVTRRQALSAAGVGICGGVLGALALPDTTVLSPPAETPRAEPAATAQPVAESEVPYAVWQYHYEPGGDRDGFTRASPINVVCPLEGAAFDDVVAVFERAGMAGSPLEYTLYAWDRAEREYRQPTWSGADNVFGLAGRVDVRCWRLDGTASIQAHVDSPATPKHEAVSYADGRAVVERVFRDAGWQVDPAGLAFHNDKAPDHDGTVSVIRL